MESRCLVVKKMKDSGIEWIGTIPSNWEVRKIKNYYSLQTGFTPDTKNNDYYSEEYGFDWITISDLNGNKTIPPCSKSKISQIYVDKFKPQIVPKGSLLYSFKLSVGQVAFADRDIYTNEAIASFLQSNDVNLNFLYYSSFMILENANENIYGAKLLNQDLIRNAYIVFPPLDIQNKISDFLDEKVSEIDFVIGKAKETIEDYKKYKQAIITQAVTKGLNPDVIMIDSKIYNMNFIPAHWNLVKFKYLATLNNGKEVAVEDGNIPVYGSGGIFKYTDKPLHTGTSLLLGRKGTIDKPMLVNGSFWTVDTMFYTSEIKGISEKYLFYCTSSIIDFGFYKSGSVLPSMTQTELNNIYITVPPFEEQQQIADYLDQKCSEIDTLISQKGTLIADLEKYKKSLIYEAVTGKIEIE